MKRSCAYDIDQFCYICGCYISNNRRYSVEGEKIGEAYEKYFGLCLTQDKNKKWAPSFCCSQCSRILLSWLKGENRKLKFGIPRVWREPRSHTDGECYFCSVKIYPGRKKNIYPNVPSSLAPVDHSIDLPVPSPPKISRMDTDDSSLTTNSTNEDFKLENEPNQPVLINFKKFEAISKDLKLSKRGSIKLLQHLKENNLTDSSVTQRSIQNRSEAISEYIREENGYGYCFNVPGLITHLYNNYFDEDWILFLDGSTKSLKGVLLHRDNFKPPVPIFYGKHIKEEYESFSNLFAKISYPLHQWKICGDFKVTTFFK